MAAAEAAGGRARGGCEAAGLVRRMKGFGFVGELAQVGIGGIEPVGEEELWGREQWVARQCQITLDEYVENMGASCPECGHGE